MKDFIPFMGTRKARDAVDDVFSREVLGSILLGLASGKVIEQMVVIAAPTVTSRLVVWTGASGVFFVTFVYWDQIETRVKDELRGAPDPDDTHQEPATDGGPTGPTGGGNAGK